MSPALLDEQAPPTAHPKPRAASVVKRSTKRDGTRNKIETWALSNLGPMWTAIQRCGPLERFVNRKLIDSACMKAPPRPYRLSTLADHTSWDSLTDKTYNTRQLPPPDPPAAPPPPAEQVAALFTRVGATELCPKSTVLFAYFAQWFTDGFLRSRRPEAPDQYRDLTRNEANPDVDLTPLYGHSAAMTDALRAKNGGRLKSTTIDGEEFPVLLCHANGVRKAEFAALSVLGFDRLDAKQKSQLFAMGSDAGNSHIGYAMINVLFLREHNRIAGELAAAYPSWDDDRLFDTTRAILTVVLIKLTIEEYINHIAPYRFRFQFDATGFYDASWYGPNWVAVEFNLLYRWHPLVPDTLRVHGEDLTIQDTVFNNELLTRHGLGPAFDGASRQRAGKVALFNTAAWFDKRTSLPSILQSRKLNLRSYNDYREDCGFPRVTDFDQITSDLRVRDALRDTYAGVDDIEFFVGLFAEDARPNSVLPSLLGRMVGLHAFSQLMTNPLLARGIYDERTFSALGMKMIESTTSIDQLLQRNLPAGSSRYEARLTRKGWERE